MGYVKVDGDFHTHFSWALVILVCAMLSFIFSMASLTWELAAGFLALSLVLFLLFLGQVWKAFQAARRRRARKW